MNALLKDFLQAGKSCRPGAIFEGDERAAEISSRMSKNQRRKYLRYGQIPSAFLEYLRISGIIYTTCPIHKGPITESQLLDLLWSNRHHSDAANYIYKEIMKEKYPPNSRSFDSAQHFWQRLQNSKVAVEVRSIG